MHQISAAKRRRINELQRIDPRYNLFILVFAAQWALGAGWAVWAGGAWASIPGYLLAGTAIQGLAIMMHEGVHGRMFDPRTRGGRFLNRWVGVVLAMPILFSATAYKVSHLHHHRHERSVEDMDEWENYTRRPWVLRLLVGAWMLVGGWMYPFHTAYHGFRLADRRTRLDIAVEYVLLVGLFGAAWAWVPSKLMLEIWLFPGMVTAVVTQVRGVAEHLCTPGDEPIRATRTVVSNRVVSAMMANLNYHLEHHMFSSVPWYRLREVHALLQEDYRAADACIERSYLRFLARLAKTLLRPVPAPGPVPEPAPRSYYVHYMPVLPGNAVGMR